MAVILPGPLVSDIRGKVGDVVFERNAGGLYVRSKGTVTQVASAARSAATDAMILLSTRYQNNFTDSQRAAWTAYARRFPDVDRWGRTKVRTGQQAYISVNFPYAVAFNEQFADSPPQVAPNPKAQIVATIDPFNELIKIAVPVDNWRTPRTAQSWIIYQGKPVYDTRLYFSSPFRFAGAFVPGASGWIDPTEVTWVFPVAEGQTSWIKVAYLDSNPRQCSRPIIVKATLL